MNVAVRATAASMRWCTLDNSNDKSQNEENDLDSVHDECQWVSRR